MDDDLAQRLLAAVMKWDVQTFDSQRPYLKILAGVKYDQYEQFQPGMRFIESLALWLNQFDALDRNHAYEFVKNRLIYISQREMHHLAVSSYPYHIKPALIKIASERLGCSRFHVNQVVQSAVYADLKRRCLFIGLSDGSRLDSFRRGNSYDVGHEQVVPIYQFSTSKGASLRKKLVEDLRRRHGSGEVPSTFQTLVLLDDFNGSGYSLIHCEGDSLDGKLPRFFKSILEEEGELRPICDLSELHVIVVHYVSVASAKSNSEALVSEMRLPPWISVSLHAVQIIPDDMKVTEISDPKMMRLILSDRHYDTKASEDPHLRKGGAEDAKLGYAKSSLPLAIGHNSPNNSIFLLWANPEDYKGVRGLFPRVIRHRE